jgi:hypothetical protein
MFHLLTVRTVGICHLCLTGHCYELGYVFFHIMSILFLKYLESRSICRKIVFDSSVFFLNIYD